jgi:molybdopterin converting factor small subunit
MLRWVRQQQYLTLYLSTRFKLTSAAGESKAEFLARLSQAAREERDLAVAQLRKKYSSKFDTLQERLRRAEQTIMREQEQASSRKMQTVISFGTAVLGAFLGRKAVSSRSAGRLGTAMKSASQMRKESMDVARAQETAEAIKAQLAEMDARLSADIADLEGQFDPTMEELKEVLIKPKSADITLAVFSLVWLPYRRDSLGQLTPDWK